MADDDIEIDLQKFVSFVKDNKKILLFAMLLLIIIGGFYSRTRNIENLEQGPFMASPDDPYFFLRYSTIIAEEGELPEIDNLRYHPDGFDTRRENNFINYLAGYSLRFVRNFNPDATAFTIAYYLPPLLFIISLPIFFLFVKELFDDKKLAVFATGFYAFLMPMIYRTLAGNLAKEPIFMVFAFAAFYFFVKAYKEEDAKDKKILYIFSALAGVSTGLAAFGSGYFIYIMIFISAFIIFEVILDKMNKDKLIGFGMFVLLSIITTSLLTTKYGGFTGFYQQLQFQIPLAALVFGISSLMFQYFKPLEKLKNKLEMIPSGLLYCILALILIFIGAILIFGVGGFTEKVVSYAEILGTPLARDAMSRSVSENQPPTFVGAGRSWWQSFGISFSILGAPITIGVFVIMFSIGAVILFNKIFKGYKHSKYLTAAFILLSIALLFENYSPDPSNWINVLFSFKWLYIGIFGAAFLGFLYVNKDKGFEKINSIHLFIITAYIISIISANSALRLFFIMCIPAAILSAYFLIWCEKYLKEKFEGKNLELIPTILAVILIIFMIFSVSRSVSHMSSNFSQWHESMDWVSENTGEEAIMTHWWDYGYMVHARAGRRTIGDPGNVDRQRNYDIGGHVFNAYNYSEILRFTDKYELTGEEAYFVVPSEDIPKFIQISRLGSVNEETSGREVYFSVYGMHDPQRNIIPNQLRDYDEFSHMLILEPITGPSQVLEDFRINNRVYDGEATHILNYIQPISQDTGETGPLLAQIYDARTGRQETLPVNCLCEKEQGCFDVREDGIPVCVLTVQNGLINIPNKSRDILFTQLFILDRHEEIEGFEKVYDNNLPLNMNTAMGGGPLIRIYRYNWDALQQQEGW